MEVGNGLVHLDGRVGKVGPIGFDRRVRLGAFRRRRFTREASQRNDDESYKPHDLVLFCTA